MENWLYRKSIPCGGKWDVIVVGGGTAGMTAGIAAAESGASTLLIERGGSLGGSGANGQVTPMMRTGLPAGAADCRVSREIARGLAAAGANYPENAGWFNPEALPFVAEELYTRSGGELLYHTEFIDAAVEDGSIRGVLVHHVQGLRLYRAKCYIDCTGDAAVAAAAGVPCAAGSGPEHENQAMSLRFMAGHIDLERSRAFLEQIGEKALPDPPQFEIASTWNRHTPLSDRFRRALEDGVIRREDGNYFQAFSVPGMPGVLSFNCPQIPDPCHAADPFFVSRSLVSGRQMIRRLTAFLRGYLPGFENMRLLSVASMPGIRESRRIRGRYVLSEEDYIRRSKFADAVAKTAYPIDVHGSDKEQLCIRRMGPGEYMEIPFRCLVPEKIGNLLVAGRCISATFTAQSVIRIQPTCRATGEAAGLAAAYCARHGLDAGGLDGAVVRGLMEGAGPQ